MMLRMQVKKNFRLLLAIAMILALLGANFACAVEMEEYGAKYLVDEPESVVPYDIIDFKVRLYELGFYSAGVNDTTLQYRGLDDLTMSAVNLVCILNTDLVFYNDGVSNELYWRVMGKNTDGKELITPLDETYQVWVIGDSSDVITKVQNRLNQLGYDAVGCTFTAGVYDEELQTVIDEFVRCNKFVYEEGSGITVEMQELLYSDSALSYTAEEIQEEELTTSEKIIAYFKAETSILGVHLPNIVLLIVGFLLLCAIAVLVFKLLFQNKGKETVRKAGEVEFKIEYGNESMVHYTNVMKKYVRIGRATGDFPLNPADGSISRKHCEICYENGNYMLRDFSTHGTVINGSKCHHTQQVLHSGDVLEVGKHRITITF